MPTPRNREKRATREVEQRRQRRRRRNSREPRYLGLWEGLALHELLDLVFEAAMGAAHLRRLALRPTLDLALAGARVGEEGGDG
ncbi:hypothetical protein E2562_038383 [Oryza meyeriana var. granulata]|uniref:Uncharacterized protein n=1 Tax=Oryza meyeriana var. granulata TaxID=110450 RepID=A0A6G1CXM6_9ORYZ|nr:hypothetical protein E2562_038383 [Oryza meyeriana var. granulata]